MREGATHPLGRWEKKQNRICWRLLLSSSQEKKDIPLLFGGRGDNPEKKGGKCALLCCVSKKKGKECLLHHNIQEIQGKGGTRGNRGGIFIYEKNFWQKRIKRTRLMHSFRFFPEGGGGRS